MVLLVAAQVVLSELHRLLWLLLLYAQVRVADQATTQAVLCLLAV
jgi:hypothetical protein